MEQGAQVPLNFQRLPKTLQERLSQIYFVEEERKREDSYLKIDQVYLGDARELLLDIRPNSVSLSVWSPPYFVGKSYEKDMTFEEWQDLLSTVIRAHFPVIKPGGFLAINIADILTFEDPAMPRIQAEVVSARKISLTREEILEAMRKYPHYNRYDLAKLFGVSEQTIDRRLNGNNVRGGKHAPQTRVKIVGGLIEQWGMEAGFYLYDRRVWVKDPAWHNSRWASVSYKSVDEFEYIYIFWKPGVTKVNRKKLTKEEWKEWGSRGVWYIPSVRANDDHEAKFPLELPRRLIKLLTEPGELVMDCFLGSGTTAVAALLENRHFIGIEIMPEYVQLAKQNIAAAQEKLC